MRGKHALPAVLLAATVLSGNANARVTGFQIQSTSPAFEGATFADTGAYERIDAIATIAVDPDAPANAGIVDLDKAPRNAKGEVEFTTEVFILRPADAKKQSPFLFYEVPNRGRNLSFTLLNRAQASGVPAKAEDAGDGFLMNRGSTVVWSGWQFDVPEAGINITLPKLPGVKGTSREQMIFDKPGETGKIPLTYAAADLDPSKARLTVRATPEDAPATPEGLTFKYVSNTEIEITRPAGLDAGAIYDFVYPAEGSVPLGLAFAATRDVISFLRGNEGHDAENPLTGIKHTVGMGISQSGRFLRDFIYQGFNADEGGHKVFDGAMAHIAGSRKSFTNYRFAQPGRYSRQHEDHDYPGDQFPFTYALTTDPLTNRRESILSTCMATDTCPKIMHSDTSTEFWQGRAYLVSTSPEGEPLAMPDNVRLYFLAGAPHFNGWGLKSEMSKTCVNPTNPLSAAPVMRALYAAMEDWVAEDKAPPASRYPTFSDETLVKLDDLKLPIIDGVAARPKFNTLRVMDHSVQPPLQGATYAEYVPAVDKDGIPLGGIRLPAVAAPLGSYAGWNLRAKDFAEGELCSLTGSYQPFPATAAANDSRTPVKARYKDQQAYLDAVKVAADGLIAEGLMLSGDTGYVLESAKADAGAVWK
ncbi:alpha/beta hydrolase domain-containing protein [Pannonibacter sp. Pt2]|uniref:Alpha/beta hydrolase domain-containing protein n=1 Tax=Pannonibacter anstelovis TaxID=3121537 RepID=A0ABU7ZQR1_9HYPH